MEETSTFAQSVAAFTSDPEGVDEEVVARVEGVLRKKYCVPDDHTLRISPGLDPYDVWLAVNTRCGAEVAYFSVNARDDDDWQCSDDDPSSFRPIVVEPSTSQGNRGAE